MGSNDLRRVLVVDDDRDARAILARVLRERGLLVDEAPDGEQALSLLGEHRYTVVLLDLIMPGRDGFAVLEAIHGGDVTEPPVVLVVSGADRALLRRLDASRIHGVIRKPFDPDDVASVVVACVEIRGTFRLGTMALATVISGAPWMALLKL